MQAGESMKCASIPGREKILSSSGCPYRSVLGPTQTPVQWVPGSLLGSESDWGVKLNSRLYLMLKLRERKSIPSLPYMLLFPTEGLFYFYFTYTPILHRFFLWIGKFTTVLK
jgi:hypothetical protein